MKKQLRPVYIVLSAASTLVLSIVFQASAVGPLVSKPGNKHNLSNANTDSSVKYRASGDAISNPRGSQICIFCHTPHNANVSEQAPLWNRKFSNEAFQRYTGSTLFQIKNIPTAQYGSPNGSSKLCLSCHDGVLNLGAVNNGPAIEMVGGSTPGVIEGLASFKASTNKMRYGHHPVSFVYNAAVRDAINFVKTSYALPDFTRPEVKLDKQGRMQCTTCHDAHQNQSDDNAFYPSPNDTRKIAPFWVYGGGGASTASDDQQAVCMTCHPLLEWAGFTRPLP
jgi:hypothetical protein